MRLYSDNAERQRLTESFRVAWRGWPQFLPIATVAIVTVGLAYGWTTAIPPLLALLGAAVLGTRLQHPRAGELIIATASVTHLMMLAMIALAGRAHTEYLLALDAIPLALVALVLPRRLLWWVTGAGIATLVATAVAVAPQKMLAIPAYAVVPAIFAALTVVGVLAVRDQNLVTRTTAVIDPLTGQLGRLALGARLDELDAVGSRRSLLAVVDVDRFKSVNDRHGHQTGDRALAEVARRMRAALGDDGVLYRYGGDEFVILMADRGERSTATLERVRAAVAGEPAAGLPITISIGSARGPAVRSAGHEDLLLRADAALREAKRGGRDRVFEADGPPPPERRLPSLRRGPRSPAPALPMPAPPRIPRPGAVPPAGDDAEREHRRMMITNAYRHSRPIAVLAPLAAIVRGPWFGWWHPVPIIVGGIVLRPLVRRWDRTRNPALLAIVVALLSNVITPISQALADRPAFFALPMIALTGLSAAAVLDVRGGLIVWSGASLCLLASVLLVDPAAIVDPGVALVPWLLICFTHLLGRRTGQAMLATRREVLVDPLTGTLNRVALDARIPSFEFASGGPAGRSALMVCDLDSFKAINDTYGHAFGDQALRAVAGAIGSELRAGDGLYRIGGDEFVVLLDDMDAAGAAVLAERIRRVVASTPLGAVPVTVSIGVAAHTGPSRGDYGDMFARADRALYAAKRAGRDRIVLDDAEAAAA